MPLHARPVRIYTCGPTVYDFAHIGNFRTFVFQDILRRFLRSRGFAGHTGDELHRRGRPHHRQGVRGRRGHPRLHRQIHRSVSGRPPRAGPRDARAHGARHRSHRRHGAADRAAHGQGLHVRQRWLDLFPHLQISRLRQALEDGRQRHPGRRARGRGSLRQDRRARFRAVEGAQARRNFLGDAPSGRAGPAGTSSAPPWP